MESPISQGQIPARRSSNATTSRGFRKNSTASSAANIPMSMMWPDRFTTSDDEAEYLEELDLGAEESEEQSDPEEPSSPMSTSTLTADASPGRFFLGATSRRPRSLRSDSFAESRPAREFLDRDCSICLANATKPCRTLCCGRLFCMEHISEWLHSDSRCPSCRAPCTLAEDTLYLPGTIARARPHSQPPAGRNPLDDFDSIPEPAYLRSGTSSTAEPASPPDLPPYSETPLLGERSRGRSFSHLDMAHRAAEPPNLLLEEDLFTLLSHPRMKLVVSTFLSPVLNAIGILIVLYVLLS